MDLIEQLQREQQNQDTPDLIEALQPEVGPAVDTSLGVVPDQRAKDLNTSRKSGFNVEDLEANRDVVDQEYERQDLIDELERAPKSSLYFTQNPEVLPAAKDDINTLTKIEERLSFFGAAERGIDLLQQNYYAAAEATGEMFGAKDLIEFGREGRISNEAQISAQPSRMKVEDINNLDSGLQWLKETFGEQGVMMAPSMVGGLAGAKTGLALTAAIPVPGARIAGASIGGFLGAFIPNIFQSVGEVQSAIKQKDPDVVRPDVAFGAGSLVSLLDSAVPGKVGTKIIKAFGIDPKDAAADAVIDQLGKSLTRRIGSAVKGGGKSSGIEGVTEGIQEALTELAATYAAGQDVNVEELTSAILNGFAGGLVMGGAIGSSSTAVSDAYKTKRAREYRDNMNTILDHTRDSLLHQRSPEVFQEFFEALAGADLTEINVAAQPIVAYLQGQNVDPVETLEALGVDMKQANRAFEQGGDITIPAARFFDAVSDGPLFELRDGFLMNVREKDDAPTLVEGEADTAATEARLVAQVDQVRQDLEGTKELDQVEQDAELLRTTVTEEIAKTGRYTRAGAQRIAALYENFFITQATDPGMDKPLTLQEVFPELRMRSVAYADRDTPMVEALEQSAAETAAAPARMEFMDDQFGTIISAIGRNQNEAHVARIDIDTFLDLTTTPETRETVETEDPAVSNIEPFDEVLAMFDPAETERVDENAIPFIAIDEYGKVIGHEGRHRAVLLKRGGATTMPIAVQYPAGVTEFGELSGEPMPTQLTGQFDATIVRNMPETVLASPDNIDEMRALVGEGSDTPAAARQNVYHVTFTDNVEEIAEGGLKQLQPSNYVRADGERYNADGGVFAFENAEDAVRWALRMDFDYPDRSISIVEVDRGDVFEIDPSEDPSLQTGAGAALRSMANIPADRIGKITEISSLERAEQLGITLDEWLAQTAQDISTPAAVITAFQPPIFKPYPFKGLAKSLVGADNPDLVRTLVDEDQAFDTLAYAAETDNITPGQIRSAVKQVYDATQSWLGDFPDTITVYRYGELRGDDPVSFTLNPNFTGASLPWMDRTGSERLQAYTVNKKDILAAPNAVLRPGLGTDTEYEVVIPGSRVRKASDTPTDKPRILFQDGLPVVPPGVEADVNKHGVAPYLRERVEPAAPLPPRPLFTQETNNKNALGQIANLDPVLANHPDAHTSPENWLQMMAEALANDDVPAAPNQFIKAIANKGAGAIASLKRLTPGQIAAADHGFKNAARFRKSYINGDIGIEHTTKLFLWSFLSRGVSPYAQESMFLDIYKGIDKFIAQAAKQELDLDAYLEWSSQQAPLGSGQPGAGTSHNLNAFGRDFLRKMSLDVGDGTGRSRLQYLHDMMTDPKSTGKQIRRAFATFGQGVGIDNKVLSFTLLVAGFDDVMVIDRVQLRQMWNDGRFTGYNLWDGVKVPSGADPTKKITKTGSALEGILAGARGLLIYEAIERGIQQNVKDIYTALGRPKDGSVGRYHWETWIADSAQEASHGTLDAVIADAVDNQADAIHKTTSMQGEYGTYAYGARYGVASTGIPYFNYTAPGGLTYVFRVEQFVEFLEAMKNPDAGVIPRTVGQRQKTNKKGEPQLLKSGEPAMLDVPFSVSKRYKTRRGKLVLDEKNQPIVLEELNAPWWSRPEVNEENISAVAIAFAEGIAGDSPGTVRGPDGDADLSDRPPAAVGATGFAQPGEGPTGVEFYQTVPEGQADLRDRGEGKVRFFNPLVKITQDLNLPAWKNDGVAKGSDIWTAIQSKAKDVPASQIKEVLKWSGLEEMLILYPQELDAELEASMVDSVYVERSEDEDGWFVVAGEETLYWFKTESEAEARAERIREEMMAPPEELMFSRADIVKFLETDGFPLISEVVSRSTRYTGDLDVEPMSDFQAQQDISTYTEIRRFMDEELYNEPMAQYREVVDKEAQERIERFNFVEEADGFYGHPQSIFEFVHNIEIHRLDTTDIDRMMRQELETDRDSRIKNAIEKAQVALEYSDQFNAKGAELYGQREGADSSIVQGQRKYKGFNFANSMEEVFDTFREVYEEIGPPPTKKTQTLDLFDERFADDWMDNREGARDKGLEREVREYMRRGEKMLLDRLGVDPAIRTGNKVKAGENLAEAFVTALIDGTKNDITKEMGSIEVWTEQVTDDRMPRRIIRVEAAERMPSRFVGYLPVDTNGNILDAADSYNEALVRLSTSETSGATEWDNFVIDMGDGRKPKSYREFKLIYPDLPGRYKHEQHRFKEDNIIAFGRVTTRDLRGKNTLMLDEGQSDIDTAQKKFGSVNERVREYKEVQRLAAEVRDKIIEPLDRLRSLRGDAEDVLDTSVTDGQKQAMAAYSDIVDILSVFEFRDGASRSIQMKGGVSGVQLEQHLRDIVRTMYLDLEVGDKVQRLTGIEPNYLRSEMSIDLSEFTINEVRFPDDTDRKDVTLQIMQEKPRKVIQKKIKKFLKRALTFQHILDNVTDPDVVGAVQDLAAAIGPITEKGPYLKTNKDLDSWIMEIPDAPLMDDAWTMLLMKRMLVEAVEKGHDAIAWSSSGAVSGQWSPGSQKMYANLYDQKYPSATKKLTGAEPKLYEIDDDIDFENDATAEEEMLPVEPGRKLPSFQELKPVFEQWLDEAYEDYDRIYGEGAVESLRFDVIDNLDFDLYDRGVEDSLLQSGTIYDGLRQQVLPPLRNRLEEMFGVLNTKVMMAKSVTSVIRLADDPAFADVTSEGVRPADLTSVLEGADNRRSTQVTNDMKWAYAYLFTAALTDAVEKSDNTKLDKIMEATLGERLFRLTNDGESDFKPELPMLKRLERLLNEAAGTTGINVEPGLRLLKPGVPIGPDIIDPDAPHALPQITMIDLTYRLPGRLAFNETGSIQGPNFSSYRVEEMVERLGGFIDGLIKDKKQAINTKQGYWFLPIDEELAETIRDNGFPLMQDPIIPRGRAVLGEQEIKVEMFENADLSTMLHETGHVFVNLMERVALRAGASERQKDIYSSMLDYVGAGSAADLDPRISGDAAEEKQEKLARAFEAYLREGKAPSNRLRQAFAVFKEWLKQVYQSLTGLDVELTDEVRSVFDKMLATDAEIDQMHATNGMDTTVSAPELFALLSAEERVAWNDLDEEAKENARRTALNEEQQALQQESEEQFQQRLEVNKQIVERQMYENRPEYRAFHFLVNGEFFVGETPASLADRRISKAMLLEMGYTQEDLNALPKGRRRIYTDDAATATDPSLMATAMRFDSVEEMMTALKNMTPPGTAIDRDASMMTRSELGDPLNDGSIERLTEEALYNEKRAGAIQLEFDALARQTGQQRVARDTIKAIVDRIFDESPVSEILKPMRYQSAAVRAARETERAIAKKDFVEAFRQKRLHMLNHELFRRALQGRTDVERITRRLRNYQRTRMDSRSIDKNYIGQVKNLLEFYEFSGVSVDRLEEQTAADVMAFIEKQRAAGEAVIMPGNLVDFIGEDANGTPQFSFKVKSWKQMTMTELEALRDMADNLVKMGRQKSAETKERKARRGIELADNIRSKARPRKNKESTLAVPIVKDQRKKAMKGFFPASHRKLESMMFELDGFENLGPMWSAVFDKITEAQNTKTVLVEMLSKEYSDIFDVYTPKERYHIRREASKVAIEGLGGKGLTREQRMAIALNWGNESSQEALLESGDFVKQYGEMWNEETILEVLATLDKRDVQVINRIWKMVNQFWEDVNLPDGRTIPGISSLERESTGVVPERVEAIPFIVGDKAFTGGYYPLKYNPYSDQRAARESEEDLQNRLKSGGFSRAQTSHGFTIARIGSGGRPVQLDLGVMLRHMDEVSQDIAFRTAINEAAEILGNTDIQEAIVGTMGEAYLSAMQEVLVKTANGNLASSDSWADLGVLKTARLNTTVALMGLNLRSILTQPFGLTQSIARLGIRRTIQGVGEFWHNPASIGRRIAEIDAKSTFMRERAKMLTREVDDVVNKLDSPGFNDEVRKLGFSAMILMDVVAVAYPTWIGAYNKAMDGDVEGVRLGDETAAIKYADMTVRTTQGSGGASNLSMVQQSSELSKLMTMFYSYFNTTYNLQTEAYRKMRAQGISIGSVAEFLGQTLMLQLIPAVLGALLLDALPSDEDLEDDPEGTWAMWTLMALIKYGIGQVVGYRDVGNSITSGFNFQLTPVEGTIQKGIKSVRDLKDIPEWVEEGEIPDTFVKNALTVFGMAAGIPGSIQMVRMYDYYKKLQEGTLKTDPESTFEEIYGALIRGDKVF